MERCVARGKVRRAPPVTAPNRTRVRVLLEEEHRA
jgi:hypothetical protein